MNSEARPRNKVPGILENGFTSRKLASTVQSLHIDNLLLLT